MAAYGNFGVFTAEPALLDAYNQGQSQGFTLFGPAHLVWIAICAAIIIAAVRWYRYLFKRERATYEVAQSEGSAAASDIPEPGAFDSGGHAAGSLKFLRVLAVVMLLGLVAEDILKASANAFTAPWWPLHLCNFAELFCLIYAIRPNRVCRELLLTLGLSGGFTAILFPGWSYCPPYTFPVISGFVQHSLIFAISLSAVSDWRTSPTWRDIPYIVVFIAAFAVFFRWFNVVMGTNFGFVTTPVAGTPLAWWADAFGNPGYLVPYALVFAVAVAVLHGACALQRRKAAARVQAVRS